MITIRGTSKIKGALDLSGIGKQLRPGEMLPISNEEFNDHTVQLAVKMGFLSYEQGGLVDVASKSIKVRNIYDRSIRLNAIDGEVRPGETFILSEDQINSADIRGAMAKGLLEIVSSVRSSEDTTESTVRVGNLFSEEEPISQPAKEEDYLETNEEITDPSVIDVPDPQPVEKDGIPDPKGKTVIWNPTHKPVAHAKTQMESVSIDKQGETEVLETNVEISNEISFVDEKMDAERRKAHPILKDKPLEDDDGIDFL